MLQWRIQCGCMVTAGGLHEAGLRDHVPTPLSVLLHPACGEAVEAYLAVVAKGREEVDSIEHSRMLARRGMAGIGLAWMAQARLGRMSVCYRAAQQGCVRGRSTMFSRPTWRRAANHRGTGTHIANSGVLALRCCLCMRTSQGNDVCVAAGWSARRFGCPDLLALQVNVQHGLRASSRATPPVAVCMLSSLTCVFLARWGRR